MSLMFQPLQKYATFEGRARRAEFWLFALFQFLLICLLGLCGAPDALFTIVWLGLLVPNCALGVRRLHDRNLSGWFYLIACLPFIGGIFMLIIGLLRGTDGDNNYGPQPQ